MVLSNELISQFAKLANGNNEEKKDITMQGTIVEYDGVKYVRIDGSDLLTPISSTVNATNDDRVTVTIKNHTAMVNGNLTSPAAKDDDVKDVVDQISEFEIVIADKVSVKDFDAEKGRIDDLVSDNILVKETLKANSAEIGNLTADNVFVKDTLKANSAEIEELRTKKLDADIADLKFATIENLDATNIDVHNLHATFGDFSNLTAENFKAQDALIKKLQVDKISANDIEGKFANIDFANIGDAAIENLIAKSGIISDAVIGDGHVTGKLVGVTIIGDLIEGGTIKADKLVVQGEDGLYYKLNVTGESVSAKQTEYNSLNGSIITAKSITAEKVNVNDLVAFGATIGGFKIGDGDIHSGAKASADNTTRGIYFGADGQIAIGDGTNFIRYIKDKNGKWKLEISADSLKISSSNTTIEETINGIKDDINSVKDEVTTNIVIESSRGNMFKNSSISTTLVAVVYRGSQQICDISALKSSLGDSAYIQWFIKRLGEEEFSEIPRNDPRLGSDGFTLTLNPGDIDVLGHFKCELMK